MAVPQRVLDIMQSGDVYLCDDEEMLDAQRAQLELLYDFNATRPGRPAAAPPSCSDCSAASARAHTSNHRCTRTGGATRSSARGSTRTST